MSPSRQVVFWVALALTTGGSLWTVRAGLRTTKGSAAWWLVLTVQLVALAMMLWVLVGVMTTR